MRPTPFTKPRALVRLLRIAADVKKIIIITIAHFNTFQSLIILEVTVDRNPSFGGFNDATLGGCNVLEKKTAGVSRPCVRVGCTQSQYFNLQFLIPGACIKPPKQCQALIYSWSSKRRKIISQLIGRAFKNTHVHRAYKMLSPLIEQFAHTGRFNRWWLRACST